MTDQPYIYCINDKLYNLSDFVSKHPGGTNVFYNLKPQIDITPMIYSYHKDVNVVFEVLSKYETSFATITAFILFRINHCDSLR